MNHQREQLESSLQRMVAKVIQGGLADPRIRGMISVTKVKVVDDGRTAAVSVSVMPEQHESRSLHGLQSSAKHIRIEVGKLLRIRTMPHLRFELDRSLKKQAEIYATLQEVSNELESRDGGDAEPPAADDTNSNDSTAMPDTPDAEER